MSTEPRPPIPEPLEPAPIHERLRRMYGVTVPPAEFDGETVFQITVDKLRDISGLLLEASEILSHYAADRAAQVPK